LQSLTACLKQSGYLSFELSLVIQRSIWQGLAVMPLPCLTINQLDRPGIIIESIAKLLVHA
jgi:hypothetical protein